MLRITIIGLLLLSGVAYAQTDHKEPAGFTTRAVLVDGDTIPYFQLRTSYVFSSPRQRSAREVRRNAKLVKRLKKVYPLARRAGQILNEYEAQVDSLDNDRMRKRFYKEMEEQLKAEYEGEIRKLTTSEGRLLIKLIDRETGDSSYELLQELRNNFSAFFWQGVAKVFGQDLKSSYDPEGADREIEIIVLQIEQGML